MSHVTVARQFVIFTMVGAVGTGAHFAVLIVLVEWLGVHAITASTGGFIVGAAINYALNRRITFASTRRHLHAVPRFMAVAFAGMLLNTLIMAITLQLFPAHYLACQVGATGAVLLWNFCANRWWTFRSPLTTGVRS